MLVEGNLDDSSRLTLDKDSLAFLRITDADLAELIPGSDTAKGGALSGLPTLRGLGDDRIRTLVDGVPLTAACPMHMNPPLSYATPSAVQTLTALPGVTPVSLGGDSIGGTIAVQTAKPAFSPDATRLTSSAEATSLYRSNSSAVEIDADAAVASDRLSLGYQGMAMRSGDYEDGRGERIHASRLEDSTQQISVAARSEGQLLELKAGYQDMPYQGFPNADMDISANRSAMFNLLYSGPIGSSRLQASAYFHSVRHEMNGNAPDRYPPSPIDITSMGFMPTRERGEDFGYRVELESPLSAKDLLRIGSEFHGETLDDRWPGAPVGMMFDYVNLNHAARNHLGTFVEWQRQLDRRWNILSGVRNDTVWQSTGPVQSYDGLDADANAFNSGPRSKTDFNVDAALLARFQASDAVRYDFGLGRKSRSPNLYERYAWGSNTIGMISWFGDGNGYTGNPALKPEVAYTASAAIGWQDHQTDRWRLDLSTYYTRVDDYIGVKYLCDPACSGAPAAQLMFENHQARLYGAEAAASYTLANSEKRGMLSVSARLDDVHGEDTTAHSGLYRMMPLNGTLGLDHNFDLWQSRLELRAVSAKNQVDTLRLEPRTGSYAIATVRTAYSYRALRIDAAITNLLNRQYSDPLGGRWQSGLYPPGFSGIIPALPGIGRSFDLGITLRL